MSELFYFIGCYIQVEDIGYVPNGALYRDFGTHTEYGLWPCVCAVFQPVLKTLETLNLGENNLQNRGIHTLRESLMMNHSLLQLGLEHTHFTCEGTHLSHSRHSCYFVCLLDLHTTVLL
jgi:hypothetical protein